LDCFLCYFFSMEISMLWVLPGRGGGECKKVGSRESCALRDTIGALILVDILIITSVGGGAGGGGIQY
jgi:hypothetical protein